MHSREDMGLSQDDVPGSEEANAKLLEAITEGDRDGDFLRSIPEEWLNEELIQRVLMHPTISAVAIVFFPSRFQTVARLQAAIKANAMTVCANLGSIPPELWTPDTILVLLRHQQKYVTKSLKLLYGGIDKMDMDFWNRAVTVNWRVARHVPEKHFSWRIAVRALAAGGDDAQVIARLPEEYRVPALRQAVTIAKEDPLFIPWDRVDALCPTFETRSDGASGGGGGGGGGGSTEGPEEPEEGGMHKA